MKDDETVVVPTVDEYRQATVKPCEPFQRGVVALELHLRHLAVG
jgi:hypothetical protein